MYYEKLSDLTPAAVDSLYGIDAATPVVDPIFVFMIGSPGAGKSQGHAQLAELGIIKDANYCTINLDTLLESLKPFRAGSAIGHLLKNYLGELYPRAPEGARNAQKPKPPSFIHTYQSTAENVGSFSYYNDPYTREMLENAVEARVGKNMVEEAGAKARRSEIFTELDAIRGKFAKGVSLTGENIVAINDAAIKRAIARGINIVYETTLYVGTDGTVNKFDKIYNLLAPTPYKIHILRIDDKTEHIQEKIKTRQKYSMPYQEYPFYRYVPYGTHDIDLYRLKNKRAYNAIHNNTAKGKYSAEKVSVMDYNPIFNATRLTPAIEFDFMSQMNRIKRAYSGGDCDGCRKGRKTRRQRGHSWRRCRHSRRRHRSRR